MSEPTVAAIRSLYERELTRVGITGMHKAAIQDLLALCDRLEKLQDKNDKQHQTASGNSVIRSYLGDGVYVEFNDAGQFVLTTEDGERVTNTIYLEPEVCDAFVAFARIWRASDAYKKEV